MLGKLMTGTRNPGVEVLTWIHLMRVYDKMQHRSMRHLAEYDLTTPQFDVLAQLKVNEGISQQALSEQLLVTKGNVCGLIDRLESRGLVERREDPEDRRSNRLYLTEEAHALADEVIPAHEDFIRQQMSALREDEQRALHKLLRDLDKSLVL